MKLETPVSKLFMIGPTYVKRLKKLGIETVGDLVTHFPFRYDDFSIVSKIIHVQPGEKVTIQGEVVAIKNEYTKHGKKIQKAKVADVTGEIEIVWFNQPFLVRVIKEAESFNFSGKVDWFGKKVVMVSPEYESISPRRSPFGPPPRCLRNTIHTGRLVPVYPETWGVSSKWLRSRIAPLLPLVKEELKEYIPVKILLKEKFMPYKDAVSKIHFPENKAAAKKARERLAFDELFLIQLAALHRKKQWQKNSVAHRLKIDQEKILAFLSQLPFELTNAQKRCVKEILKDLSLSKPMNRLLEGDVGSGKTVVAAAAMYTTYLNGFQTVLMAPTEILAFQHHQTIKTLLQPLGLKIALQTRSIKHLKHPACRQAGLEPFKRPDIVIGTHALLTEKVKIDKLGLAIIDEQHRFGVEQRASLIKKGKAPHVLTMTATPIPRTVSLTLYGDLDLSVIDEMPQGRMRVKTWVVPQKKRKPAYEWIAKQINLEGSQAFIICPLIEESEKETMKDVKAASAEYKKLQKIFKKYKLGLLHGKVKSKEKEKIMSDFRQGKIHLLVATPVVEVGIDIPNATIMMIEGADRFGLAQLHQLRGRVGRGSKQSYCFLLSQSKSKKTFQRLRALERIYVGMELAELDLKIRGPGEIYGLRQHGLPDLRMASFTDYNLIQKARSAAKSVITNLNKLSFLQEKLEKYIIRQAEPN